jgi:AraC-like DNA-binding protein
MQDKLKALRIGVDDYLVKPFDEEELLVRIDNLLHNQAIRLKEIKREQPDQAAEPILSEEDREWLEAFEAYVQKNIASELLDVQLLAQEFAMSQSTLLRQMKRLIGMTPNQYLQEVRLNEARKMLENQVHNSISKVAAEVGYTDSRSFSRRFKKRFGKLPSEIN